MRSLAVIGFVGENANGVLHTNSEALNYHFGQRDIPSFVVDLRQADCTNRLQSIGAQHDILLGYGYAGIGAHLKTGDASLWDKFQIPFLSLMYDHPFYNPALHSASARSACNCYAVRDFYDVQRDYIKSPQPAVQLKISSNGYVIPHERSWNERDIDALFIKTGYDLRILEDSFKVMPPAFHTIVWDCIRTAQKDGDIVLTDFVRDGFAASGIDFRRDQQTWDDFVYIVRVINQYLRYWRSEQLVEKLKHLPITIVGDGWDHIDKTNAKAKFLPAIQAPEVDPLVRRTKFILNTHPYARYAWHERVFQGLESGAAVISDRTRFTDEHFADLPNFIEFSWSDSSWPDRIASSMEEIRRKPYDCMPGRKRLAERFPPDATAVHMIDIATQIRNGTLKP